MNAATLARVLAAAEDGMSTRNIAALCGVSPTTVARALALAGLAPSKQHDAYQVLVARSRETSAQARHRAYAREAEESRRAVARLSADIRIHEVDAEGELRVIVRLMGPDEAVVNQVSVPGDCPSGIGHAVMAMLRGPLRGDNNDDARRRLPAGASSRGRKPSGGGERLDAGDQ